MWGGFPVWDDAYLVLFLRESTLETLAAHHSHRPLFGQLLKWSAAAFGLDRGPYVAMALALWAILAWQTARLARRVRPDDAFLPSLAALLVLTPVLVTTQFTTATTVLSVNLPVSLALAALLTCLAADAPVGRTRGLGAALLVAGAVAISEYGIAAGFAAAAFLAARRRVRDAGWVAAGMVAGYAVFRAFSHVEVRAKQLPSVQIRNFLARASFRRPALHRWALAQPGGRVGLGGRRDSHRGPIRARRSWASSRRESSERFSRRSIAARPGFGGIECR